MEAGGCRINSPKTTLNKTERTAVKGDIGRVLGIQVVRAGISTTQPTKEVMPIAAMATQSPQSHNAFKRFDKRGSVLMALVVTEGCLLFYTPKMAFCTPVHSPWASLLSHQRSRYSRVSRVLPAIIGRLSR